MFFRREKPHQWTFEERIADLKKFGFEKTSESPGAVRVSRKGYAARVKDEGAGSVSVGKSGLLLDGEIAVLTNAGYQMFFRTPAGREVPATAVQLRSLHDMDEDLREGLGLISLYNTSLGTTSEDHLYDRVEERDAPPHRQPWEKKTA